VEQPELQDTWTTLSAARDDIAFLGVAVRDNEAAAKAFREEFGVTYPSVFDETNELAHALGVTAPPATAIVDGDGIVRYLHIGQITGTTAGCLVTAVADE
jgi:cytochrome c biogenesis protein CcmG/thiol:disulfide interchange protein DsbE